MHTHIKVLGWLHIVMSVLIILMGLAGFALFGGIAGVIGMSDDTEGKLVAMPIMGALAGFALIFMLVIAIPGLIVGWGLINYRSWSRILGIVLSALELLNVPFGTVLGIYGLWVLLNDQTTAILEGRWAAPVAPQAGVPPYPR